MHAPDVTIICHVGSTSDVDYMSKRGAYTKKDSTIAGAVDLYPTYVILH